MNKTKLRAGYETNRQKKPMDKGEEHNGERDIMKTQNLSELYDTMQKGMRNNLEMGRHSFSHPGTKGDITENHWIDWLRKYLPKRYSVDKAFVIDSENHVSEQIDVVVYDRQYSHPVFVIGEGKYVTAESVYAVFEVKQDLKKENIEYAGQKIKSVRELRRTSAPIESANGHAHPKPLHWIISGLLTLDSDWVMPIHQNTVQYMMARPSQERVDLICCLNCGSFGGFVHNRGCASHAGCSKAALRFRARGKWSHPEGACPWRVLKEMLH